MAKQKYTIQFIVSLILVSGFLIGVILFFTIDSFRFRILDAYNSVFKVIVIDRELGKVSKIYSNIPYCNSDDPRQTLDIYLPKESRPAPARSPHLVLFIHGGGWRAGDKSNDIVATYGNEFLRSGYALATINYRLYPAVTYPEPNNDISCAISYLQKNARKYGVSSEQWAIVGDSAGAHLAAYAMTDKKSSEPLKLFIGFYGPYNLVDQIYQSKMSDGNAWDYTNKGIDAEQASPVYREPKVDATYLLLHGEQDTIVEISQSEQFYEILLSQQIDAKLIEVKNAKHYFGFNASPNVKSISDIIIAESKKSLQTKD